MRERSLSRGKITDYLRPLTTYRETKLGKLVPATAAGARLTHLVDSFLNEAWMHRSDFTHDYDNNRQLNIVRDQKTDSVIATTTSDLSTKTHVDSLRLNYADRETLYGNAATFLHAVYTDNQLTGLTLTTDIYTDGTPIMTGQIDWDKLPKRVKGRIVKSLTMEKNWRSYQNQTK